MNKKLSFFLCFILLIVVSCSKNESKITEDESFVKTAIEFDVRATPCGGNGYLLFPLDSAKIYKADSLPPNAGSIIIPGTFDIKYHIIGNECGTSLQKVIIDTIRI